MSHPHSDLATNTIAIASIIIPFWLPGIAQISADAAIALPILGALWLILQIALKIHAFYKGRNH